jgi:hypothetical protein
VSRVSCGYELAINDGQWVSRVSCGYELAINDEQWVSRVSWWKMSGN